MTTALAKPEQVGGLKEIQLTLGQVALVDEADYDWLMQWKWSAHAAEGGGYYARASDVRFPASRRRVYMHRLILGIDSGDRRTCDHRNRNKLDNRRENLRPASHAENIANRAGYGSSGFKGVMRFRKRWKAEITLNKRTIFLGSFATPQEAHSAYCNAAEIHRGEFACTESRPHV